MLNLNDSGVNPPLNSKPTANPAVKQSPAPAVSITGLFKSEKAVWCRLESEVKYEEPLAPSLSTICYSPNSLSFYTAWLAEASPVILKSSVSLGDIISMYWSNSGKI